MRDFSEFIAYIQGNIIAILGNGYEKVQTKILTDCLKNNSRLTGLSLKLPEEDVSTVIYLDEFYERYTEGEQAGILLKEIADTYRNNSGNTNIKLDFINDWQSVKDMVLPKIINTDNNRDLCNGKPHRTVWDMTVLYYIPVNMGNKQDSASVTITDQLFSGYKITENVLFEAALSNLFKKTTIMPINTVIDNLGMSSAPDPIPMYVLSTNSGVNGAACMLISEQLDAIATLLGTTEIFVLPSSIHEVIIVPAGMAYVDELLDLVKTVNATQVEPKDRLTDSVYSYDSASKALIKAA